MQRLPPLSLKRRAGRREVRRVIRGIRTKQFVMRRTGAAFVTALAKSIALPLACCDTQSQLLA